MAYEDAANYNTVKSMKGLPVGAIIPWSGATDTIPYGWIACDGAAIPTTKYPLLYDAIGITYGGTSGSTFKLPPLNSLTATPMDIFQGHFDYLQSSGDAHKPEFTSVTSDPFWKTVGKSDNGNQSNDVNGNKSTVMDVYGEQISKPDLNAKYGDFALSTGDTEFTVTIVERKLSDRHLPSHSHGWATDDGQVSYSRKTSQTANLHADKIQDYWPCYVTPSKTAVSRSTNDPPLDGTQMASLGSTSKVSTTYRRGGGNIIAGSPSPPQTGVTELDNGDGYSSGNMYSAKGGTQYFFSSLSNDNRNFDDSFSGHTHQSITYKWESKIQVVNPGLVNDCKMNTVTIDNTPGKGFCTINMEGATPSLSMLFIIRAF